MWICLARGFTAPAGGGGPTAIVAVTVWAWAGMEPMANATIAAMTIKLGTARIFIFMAHPPAFTITRNISVPLVDACHPPSSPGYVQAWAIGGPKAAAVANVLSRLK